MSGDKVVYLISGTSGVGKSTLAKELTQSLKPSALITGDDVNKMLLPGSELPMDQRFSLTWENMILLAKSFLRNDLNVVIEWILQNDLERICERLSDSAIQIKYVVLRANEDTLKERLGERGDSHLLDRSLFLLQRLDALPFNNNYLYDTTGKQTSEIVQDILASDEYIVNKDRGF
ncbi:AAA family ATPase [Paenibacillus sp. NPDC056579]|uniref:AAA family ATPase n=1 Tax=Paenibacillus sp. NPDC056579 TaxID=3345871 RepID=UPI0036951B7A